MASTAPSKQPVSAGERVDGADQRGASSPRFSTRVEPAIVAVADAIVLGVLVFLAESLVLTAVTAAVAALTWKMQGLYRRRIALSVLDDLPKLAMGVLVGVAPAAATALTLGVGPVGGSRILVVGATIVGAIAAVRCAAYALLLRLRASGLISYPTLMLGSGSAATSLIERIQQHPESGLRLVGIVANNAPRLPRPLPLLGPSQDLAKLVKDHRVSNVVIGYGGIWPSDLIDVLRTADRLNVEIHVVPRLFELSPLRGSDDHIWGLPLIRLRSPAHRVLGWHVKRAFDVVGALLAMILVSPVMVGVAIAVRLELGPNIFFRQTRVGQQGRPFDLVKFRSMRPSVTGVLNPWTISPDEIGPVGRFIRRYSLDELPQLVNVLRGDMSLVGPRPERPEYVEQFMAMFPWYAHRHRVPVGLTGLAAVNGLRGDTSIEDRCNFDNWYIDNWSLWLDVKILLRTARAVALGTGE